MATNRAFLLACATVVTLSLSAASSTRADAKPCHTEDSTPRQERTCLIRSAIRSVMTETAKQAAMAKQAAAKQAKSATPAALAGSPCLNKGYNNGTVIFRDTCTGEWAQREPNTPDTRASGH